MTVHVVTDASFQSFTSQAGIVLVDFTAPWCGPCQRTDPIVEQLAREMPNVKFGKVNTDENQMTAARSGVMSMPTFMVYKDGRKVDQIVGGVPKPLLADAVRRA